VFPGYPGFLYSKYIVYGKKMKFVAFNKDCLIRMSPI